MTISFKVNRSGKSKVLTQEERDLIQTHLPEKYRLISEVLYWSAGRIREVLNIRVRNLVPDQGMVVLEKETTKTKETREVFVPDQLMRELLLRVRSLGLASSDYLFFNQSPTQTTKGEQRPLSVQSFDKELLSSLTIRSNIFSSFTNSVTPTNTDQSDFSLTQS